MSISPAQVKTEQIDGQLHKVHKDSGIGEFDVFIAGSGPLGATHARLLVDAGYNVVMAEIGDQDTRVPGAHKKNEIEYQKDIDRFVKVIQGALSPVSVPISSTVVPTLDPASWTPKDEKHMYITNGRNLKQRPFNNLGAEAVTRGVGGMSTHWTCATPEFLKGLERPQIFEEEKKDDNEWDLLYNAARALIGTSEHEYDQSIRHNVVLETLKSAYETDKPENEKRIVKALPLACHRIAKGSPYVQWHSADNVFGDLFTNPTKKNKEGKQRGVFKLLTNTRCTRFVMDPLSPGPHHIVAVELKDLLADRQYTVPSEETIFYLKAKTFITAAGAVATPQILAKSGFGGYEGPPMKNIIPNLGKYITEQPMAFCQIVLKRELVEGISQNLDKKPQWWRDAVKKHLELYGKTDPLPIPFQDPEPQVTIPATTKHKWHTQIHRDAFSYGEVGPAVDSRIVVDLRFFGMQKGVEANRVYFDHEVTDQYGMPQPTFEYTPTPEDAEDAHIMMNDMTDVANKLGGYLPGSTPQFMTPGLALHLGGTTRLGRNDEHQKTVANYNGQIWNFSNLYVAGNGVIPTPFGTNPTLTSMCLAIRSAYKISQDLAKGQCTPALPNKDDVVPTPASWVNWATDKTDPNYPDHRRQLHREVGIEQIGGI